MSVAKIFKHLILLRVDVHFNKILLINFLTFYIYYIIIFLIFQVIAVLKKVFFKIISKIFLKVKWGLRENRYAAGCQNSSFKNVAMEAVWEVGASRLIAPRASFGKILIAE